LSLQRCEGANLESVLEEVRARFGDTVTIVEANRLRKGGVGGFFAKERYEVVVDVIDEEESDGPTDLPAEYGMQATEDFCDRLLSMAEGVNDIEPPAATVSTERPGFNAVLDSITRHMEAGNPEPLEPPGRRLFLRRPMEDPTPAPESPPATGLPAAPAPVRTMAPPEETPFPVPFGAPVIPGWGSPSVRNPVPEPSPGIDNRALARIGLPEELRRAALAHPAPAGGADPSTWLIGLLEHLPRAEPLPKGQGAVIVVAGARDAALDLARSIADELGLDDEALLVASPGYTGRSRPIPGHRRIHDADTASEMRRSWRRRNRPTVVAVEAPAGPSGNWARQVVDALEPTMVWAAVEASRKPEDLFEWSEQLGGFDALAVSDLDTTVSPAAVLQCGIPVGRLEGRPATPLLWASHLAPRLAT
jgi:hypothetical protein